MFIIEQALQELDFELKLDSNIYTNKLGQIVPRVTDILSKTINEEVLMRWANSLGFKHKSYTQVLNEAAIYGGDTHSLIENFYKNEETNSDNISFKAFLYWWKDINANNKVEILYIEQRLVCDYFGGTLDTLLKINDKIILVDYKTSNHITYKYLLQAAAYRYMLYHVMGINIDGIIILQLGKEEPTYNELYVDLSIEEHFNYIEYCTRTFLALVYSYYNTEYVKAQYAKLFTLR